MVNEASIRAFIAISMPEWLKDKLDELQGRLKEIPGQISWTRKTGFHLTLKFLGNIMPDQIKAIAEEMRGATSGITSFPLRVAGLGTFPHINRPRVIWIGLNDSTGNLKKIQYNLESRLEKLGYEPEGREFLPHLTLGRIKLLRNKAPLIKIIEVHKPEEEWVFQAEKVSLIKSELRPSGAIYSVLEEAMLQGGL